MAEDTVTITVPLSQALAILEMLKNEHFPYIDHGPDARLFYLAVDKAVYGEKPHFGVLEPPSNPETEPTDRIRDGSDPPR